MEVARRELPNKVLKSFKAWQKLEGTETAFAWNFTIRRPGTPVRVRATVLTLQAVKGGYIATVFIRQSSGLRILQTGGTYECLLTSTGNAGFTRAIQREAVA